MKTLLITIFCLLADQSPAQAHETIRYPSRESTKFGIGYRPGARRTPEGRPGQRRWQPRRLRCTYQYFGTPNAMLYAVYLQVFNRRGDFVGYRDLGTFTDESQVRQLLNSEVCH